MVSETFDEKEVASILNGLTHEDVRQMKENSHRAAWKYSNFQNENVLTQIIQELGALAE